MSDTFLSQASRRGRRVEDALSEVPMWIGALMVLAMLAHICAEVVLRTFFHSPIPATLEIVTYYYMVAAVFLPLAFVQKIKGHVIVEVFTTRLPAPIVVWIDRGAQVLSAIYVGVIGWWGMLDAIRATRRNEFIPVIYFDLVTWPTRWLVAISAGLMMLVILIQLYRDLRGEPVVQAPGAPLL